MWLTFATFVGYAVIYTVVLKPLTPQNIVIGGASGAMPPVLGWAAMRGEVGPEALMLCLIIFLWTPPHFWALALYRAEDYRRAGLPMLPVTHGAEFTRLHVFLYTLVLFAATLLPFISGMSGWFYLACGRAARRGLHRLRLEALARLLRRAGAQDLPLLDPPPVAAVRGAAGRPLPGPAAVNPNRRLCLLAVAALAGGCDKPARRRRRSLSFKRRRHHRRRLRPQRSRCPTRTARLRTLADFKGKVTVVFFGYTQCPDVCPTTMAELAQVKKSLGADGERVQGVFVTVDPERDTPELLKAYMASFDPSFVALRGTPEQTAATAKEFKVFYAKVPGKTEGSYTMDHTAGLVRLRPRTGKLRLFVRYGSGAEALAADLKTLLAAG